MDMKTCRKCGESKPRDPEHFKLVRRARRNGTTKLIITSPCRDCIQAQRAQFYQANLETERQRMRSLAALRRQSHGRESRATEYANKKEKAAIAAGWISVADRNAAKELAKARKALIRAMRAVVRSQSVCWLWQHPGLSVAERFAVRYRTDPEFRARQIVRAKLKKDHIRMATPRWVDLGALEAVYAGRPAGHHVDHLVPLCAVTPDGGRASGLNVPWNLRYLPGPENMKRSNRMTMGEVAEVEGSSSQVRNGSQTP